MKYLENFNQYPNSIYVMQYENSSAGKSLEEVVECYKTNILASCYCEDEEHYSYNVVEIFNCQATDVVPKSDLKQLFAQNAKDFLDKFAYYRRLLINPDFTEICAEYFSVYLDEAGGMLLDCLFDYGLLYGDYELPDLGAIYKTDMNYAINDVDFDLVRITKPVHTALNTLIEDCSKIYVGVVAESINAGNAYGYDTDRFGGSDFPKIQNFYGYPILPVASLSYFDTSNFAKANDI